MMKHFVKSMVLFSSMFLLCFVFVGVSGAQVDITFQQGFGGYAGTHDTTFQTGDPLALWGDLAEFEWDGSDAGGFNFGMLRFDDLFGTGVGQIAQDAEVIRAVLTLVVTNNGAADQIGTMHDLLTPFDDTLDFFEFGDGAAFDPRPGADYVEQALHEIPGPAAGVVLELDVTESIKKIQSTGVNHGWVFIPGGSDGVGIASSEAANNQPKLVITIGGAAPPQGTRSLSPTLFVPGGTIAVSIAMSSGQAAKDVKVVETIPTGWTASNISNGGTFAGGVITWNLAGFTGNTVLTYTANVPASANRGVRFSGVVDDSFFIEGAVASDVKPSLYRTGNVLAVGVWNTDNGSSDLVVTAELIDNNGVVYVQDSSANGGWPASTIFRWKTVLYADGAGGEEVGWRDRGFDDSDWIQESGIGFTVGHGGNDSENGEIPLDPSEESVYTRSIFDAVNYESIQQVIIRVEADDEAVAWLNGVFIGYTASGTSDRGEGARDYVFDTTISGGAGGAEAGTNPSDYSAGSLVITVPVFLADAPPTGLIDWSIH